MSAPVVTVDKLSVKFGDFYAVKEVSFSVEKGEIFGFLGANGACKTTTIRVLCGLLLATSGKVVIDGEEFVKGKEDIIKQKVGYMSQRFTLYDDLTIKENLDFAAALRQIPDEQYEKNRQKLFDFIGFKQNPNIIVKDLPGGIKQEIALCAALLHDPLIVFLDEPTAGVAPAARCRFWNLIKELSKMGKTIFVTTHYMDEAENCDWIALMRSGELIALDTSQGLKKTTYRGEQIYNLTPKKNITPLNDADMFAMFEPYGRHYHVTFKDKNKEAAFLKTLKTDYEIEKIDPSLEDVFIRLVEGKNR
ncbi:MAG: ABC transporter ATP-binding protein [Lactobacillales bacterium]|jgi:ABC-2 type transport system ATP-binding protein|nr:ABC transporter ATP-binding protein [Lactobacillales bacterium]